MIELAERKPSASFRNAGEFIRFRRKRLGLSQRYVASKSDISPSGLCKLESGDSILPRSSTVLKLSHVLKINPVDLLSFEKVEKPTVPKGLEDLKREYPNWKDILREGIKELI